VNRDIELHPIVYRPPKEPWFTIEFEENKIIVSLSKNETGQPREFDIYFADRCEEEIRVTQSSE